MFIYLLFINLLAKVLLHISCNTAEDKKLALQSLFFIDSFLCLMGGYKVYMEMLGYDL